MEINFADYLSQEEIKQIVTDELKEQVHKLFKNEENAQRLLSNLAYTLVFDEIDKVVPGCRDLIIEQTTQVLNNLESYDVFRASPFSESKSVATKIMEDAIRDNRGLINKRVSETILNKDYSEEIWSHFEQLADNFCGHIYEIARLGKEKNNKQI